MTHSLTIGVIGLGEAGLAIATGMNEEGVADIIGFDTRLTEADFGTAVRSTGIRVALTTEELLAPSDVIVNLTSAKVAEEIALAVAPRLHHSQIYADLNSTNPHVKLTMADLVESRGAKFVDGAVMAAVPPTRHRTPILLSGSGAQDLHTVLKPLQMNTEVLGDTAGQASAVKMMRSLLIKGIEALLLEFALGAHQHGVLEQALDSLGNDLLTGSWAETASYLLGRTLQHGGRRAEELRQVADTLRAVGVEPLLAASGAERLHQISELALRNAIERQSYEERIFTITEALRSKRKSGG